MEAAARLSQLLAAEALPVCEAEALTVLYFTGSRFSSERFARSDAGTFHRILSFQEKIRWSSDMILLIIISSMNIFFSRYM
jgi:hypothetical protein